MSVKTVREQILAATRPTGCASAVVTSSEVGKVLKAAMSDGKVSKGEGKLIADLYDSARAHTAPRRRPGQMMTMACPEHSGHSLDAAASSRLAAFIIKYNLPSNVLATTLAIPENGGSPDPVMVTQAIPENPGAGEPIFMTQAIPENPGAAA